MSVQQTWFRDQVPFHIENDNNVDDQTMMTIF